VTFYATKEGQERKAKWGKKLFVQEENKYALHFRSKNVDNTNNKTV